jgi:hypothetical protein
VDGDLRCSLRQVGAWRLLLPALRVVVEIEQCPFPLVSVRQSLANGAVFRFR